ncbi:MAG: PepSY-associated helix domain protein [Acidobacteriaceae bacterium]|nr:PepSY-associated helix domain protein [Acidobacteriaceae bacterium]
MTVSTFVLHPRKVFLRRALFQIHLWAGVLLSLYVVVLALTGSVLVFRSELQRAALPVQIGSYDAVRRIPIQTVLQQFAKTYPSATLLDLRMPSDAAPGFVISAKDGTRRFEAVADASTGALYPLNKGWVDWVYDLHVYLLLGHAYGMQINAVGAGVLLILCLTGLVIWWPGIKVWARGFKVSLGRNWRRVNFDLHSAIGIWTLLLVSWWAVSGIYFGFYKQVGAVVGWVSPLQGMVSPLPQPRVVGVTRAPLEKVLEAVHSASSQGRLFSISDPTMKGEVVYALVDLRGAGDFSHRDIVTVSTINAKILTVWHYGSNQTPGDWFIWAMHPLHFGTLWGMTFKVVWAVSGLSLAILSLTGVLMYWNRWLRHRF